MAKKDRPSVEQSVIQREPKKVIVKTGMIDGAATDPNLTQGSGAKQTRIDKRKRLGFKS